MDHEPMDHEGRNPGTTGESSQFSQRNFVPDDLRSQVLRQGLAYWESKCRGMRLPRRKDIDPTEMAGFLRYVILVDVVPGPADQSPVDFVFRLVGTEVADRYGRDFTGCRLTILDLDGQSENIFKEYMHTFNTFSPQYFVDDFTQGSGRFMYYERILMPLSSNGVKIDMLLGVQKTLLGLSSRHE